MWALCLPPVRGVMVAAAVAVVAPVVVLLQVATGPPVATGPLVRVVSAVLMVPAAVDVDVEPPAAPPVAAMAVHPLAAMQASMSQTSMPSPPWAAKLRAQQGSSPLGLALPPPHSSCEAGG